MNKQLQTTRFQAEALGVELPVTFETSEHMAGKRLDAVLQRCFPSLGVRGRRRLWDWCRITINNKSRPAGYLVQQGDIIVVSAKQQDAEPATHELDNMLGSFGTNAPHIIAATNDMVALYKPAGLHTAIIQGGNELSLEYVVLMQWEQLCLQEHTNKLPTALVDSDPPLLVTRLDNPTSGIVLAVHSSKVEAEFRALEAEGQVVKQYYAMVYGLLPAKHTITNALNTSNRKVTEVLNSEAESATRFTTVTPICYGAITGDGVTIPITLVHAVIHRGARHQIRAHLAWHGYPIVGDDIYATEVTKQYLPTLETVANNHVCLRWDGVTEGTSASLQSFLHTLYLHHAHVTLPHFSASCLPQWPCVPASLLTK